MTVDDCSAPISFIENVIFRSWDKRVVRLSRNKGWTVETMMQTFMQLCPSQMIPRWTQLHCNSMLYANYVSCDVAPCVPAFSIT